MGGRKAKKMAGSLSFMGVLDILDNLHPNSVHGYVKWWIGWMVELIQADWATKAEKLTQIMA